MSSAPSLSPMYSFPGWIVDDININWKASEAIVSLRKDGRLKKTKCTQCNHEMTVARKKERFVQDVPLGELKVILTFTACQMYCSHCHRFETRMPPGLGKNAQATNRLKHYVSRLCRYMPCNKVPEFVAISHDTARRWDKEVLMRTLPCPKLDGIRALLIDEKSIGKGHNYLTVVLNADTGEALFIGEGQRKEALDSFFESLTIKQRACIQCVGIDRGGSYKSSVKAYLQAADIVYDKFHIVANYNEAIDNIRRREWREPEECFFQFFVTHSFAYLCLGNFRIEQ